MEMPGNKSFFSLKADLEVHKSEPKTIPGQSALDLMAFSQWSGSIEKGLSATC